MEEENPDTALKAELGGADGDATSTDIPLKKPVWSCRIPMMYLRSLMKTEPKVNFVSTLAGLTAPRMGEILITPSCS